MNPAGKLRVPNDADSNRLPRLEDYLTQLRGYVRINRRGLVRRQQQSKVILRHGQDLPSHPDEIICRGGSRDVDGVPEGGIRGGPLLIENGAQTALILGFHPDNLKACLLGLVRRNHSHSARICQDGHSLPCTLRKRRERNREVNELLYAVCFNHTALPECSTVHVIVSDEGCGVGQCSPRPDRGPADLEDHERLLSCRIGRDLHESPAVPEPFKIDSHRLRVWIISEVLDHILDGDIELVASPHQRPYSDAVGCEFL